MTTCRTIKTQVLDWLQSPSWEKHLEEILACPPKQAINPLFSSLCSSDPLVKWHGVTAFGQVVSHMADTSMEEARVVMRRLMWSLNDESGGIGWGAPEAMGEIMACHNRLAQEFHKMLLSYIYEDESGEDNYLELDALRRGALWGVARLAQKRPSLVSKGEDTIIRSLSEADGTLRGLACLALGLISSSQAQDTIDKLTDDNSEFALYWNRKLSTVTVGQMARQALERTDSHTA